MSQDSKRMEEEYIQFFSNLSVFHRSNNNNPCCWTISLSVTTKLRLCCMHGDLAWMMESGSEITFEQMMELKMSNDIRDMFLFNLDIFTGK